jgi:hypothetical protein
VVNFGYVLNIHICNLAVIRKPLDLPPAVARAFVKDVRAYLAEEDGHKRDAIAVRQLRALQEFQNPREKPLHMFAPTKKLVR